MIVSIAQTLFEINGADEKMREYFSDFLADGIPESVITLGKEYKKDRFFEQRLEIFTHITMFLLENKSTVRVHCSCVKVGEYAYAFGAPSGTGKSTHARLWEKFCPEKAVVINDDQPYFKIDEKGVTVYSAPLSGKHNKYTAVTAPLRAFVILKQAKQNRIQRLDKRQAVMYLLKQFFLGNTVSSDKKMLDLLAEFVDIIPVYLMECDISEQAFKVCYNAVTKE